MATFAPRVIYVGKCIDSALVAAAGSSVALGFGFEMIADPADLGDAEALSIGGSLWLILIQRIVISRRDLLW